MAVCFVDIVGYTTHSKSLEEDELVVWIENFEQVATGTVVDHGGRVIKTIGDEIMFTADDPVAATEIALALTERGLDEDDRFPNVRAGIAYGLVVNRLGDVYGSTVNVASRLASVARPGSVVVDRGAYAALSHDEGGSDSDHEDDHDRPDEERSAPTDVSHDESGRSDDAPAESSRASITEQTEDESSDPAAPAAPAPTRPDYRLRRLRRVSVKGYSRLEAWRVQRPKDQPRAD